MIKIELRERLLLILIQAHTQVAGLSSLNDDDADDGDHDDQTYSSRDPRRLSDDDDATMMNLHPRRAGHVK